MKTADPVTGLLPQQGGGWPHTAYPECKIGDIHSHYHFETTLPEMLQAKSKEEIT
jgi:hypothetical protein